MLIKLITMPWYLQAYLDMAYNRTKQQKKEAGRITNIEYQKKIAAVFYYLCVVTLQYLAPIIMCLILSLMYKSLGDYTWNGSVAQECPITPPKSTIDPFEGESITKTAEEFHLALDNLKLVCIFSTRSEISDFTSLVFLGFHS